MWKNSKMIHGRPQGDYMGRNGRPYWKMVATGHRESAALCVFNILHAIASTSIYDSNYTKENLNLSKWNPSRKTPSLQREGQSYKTMSKVNQIHPFSALLVNVVCLSSSPIRNIIHFQFVIKPFGLSKFLQVCDLFYTLIFEFAS